MEYGGENHNKNERRAKELAKKKRESRNIAIVASTGQRKQKIDQGKGKGI